MSDKRLSASEAAWQRARNLFAAREERDSHIKQMIESERVKRDSHTAKLRALRLAKEEACRLAILDAPVETPKSPTRKRAAKSRRAPVSKYAANTTQ